MANPVDRSTANPHVSVVSVVSSVSVASRSSVVLRDELRPVEFVALGDAAARVLQSLQSLQTKVAASNSK